MKRIINHLKYLKKLNVVGVKQSLEDEGASFDDLRIMRHITRKAGLELNVKIGGCEAKNDMIYCQKIIDLNKSSKLVTQSVSKVLKF